jgi:hypothetical protein
LFAGNAPVIFNRVSGEYRVTGTAHPIDRYWEEYEERLPPAELQMKPQVRNEPQSRDLGRADDRELVAFVDVDDALVRSSREMPALERG